MKIRSLLRTDFHFGLLSQKSQDEKRDFLCKIIKPQKNTFL